MEELANNLPAGYVLEHYSIREVLGAGSFGITYKAYDNQLQQWVAIKEFLPSDMAGRGSDTITVQPRKDSSDQFRYGLDRFLEEARTLARFRHPNIVRVTRFLEANGTAYLVMDFVEGQSLSMYLKDHPNPVSETQLKAWFVPILQGLVTVHAAGFLHRDIKPGNIYLHDNGEPVLIDFGAARQAIGEQSKSVTGIVSAGYAPTEQYGTDAKKQGPWTDLYSVGATLYRCISAKAPTDAPTRQSALMEGDTDPLAPASVKGAGQYSPAFLQLIDELMVLPIRGRPQTVDSVLAALIAGKTEFAAEPHSNAVTVVAEKPVRADAETVVVSDQHVSFAPKKPMQPQVTPPMGVIELPKNGVNLKVLGVLAMFLAAVFGGLFLGNTEIKKFMPQNAEEKQAQYNAAVQMEGEVKDLAEKLYQRGQAAEQQRKDLEQRKRSAQQSVRSVRKGKAELQVELDVLDSELQLAEDGWVLRQRTVFESAELTELKGLLTLGSRQVLDKLYVEARTTLEQAKSGYQQLLEQDRAGEDIPLARDQIRDTKEKYKHVTSVYGLDGSTVPGDAGSQESAADLAASTGALVRARDMYRVAAQAWAQGLSQLGPEIARIEQQQAAVAAEHGGLAAEANGQTEAKVKARAQADAKESAQEAEARVRAQEEAKDRAEVQAMAQAETERTACANVPVCVVDAGGGVLSQTAKALEWTQSDSRRDVDWSGAKTWCASKGGGWRLPSVEELLSIYDDSGTLRTSCGRATCKVSPLFRLTNYWFWSNQADDSSNAWHVSPVDGTQLYYPQSYRTSLRALCVRNS